MQPPRDADITRVHNTTSDLVHGDIVTLLSIEAGTELRVVGRPYKRADSWRYTIAPACNVTDEMMALVKKLSTRSDANRCSLRIDIDLDGQARMTVVELANSAPCLNGADTAGAVAMRCSSAVEWCVRAARSRGGRLVVTGTWLLLFAALLLAVCQSSVQWSDHAWEALFPQATHGIVKPVVHMHYELYKLLAG